MRLFLYFSPVKTKDILPVLRIRDFQVELEADDSFVYHEIQGRRRIEKPHKHDFFVFLLFEKGSGVHSIDFVDYKVGHYQLHMLFPDQLHKWELEKNTRAYQLMISRHIFEAFSTSLRFSFVLYKKHPVIQLAPDVFKQLLYEFKCIQKELATKPVDWDIISNRSRLISLLTSREAEKKFKDMLIYRTRPVLYKYHSLINIHFKEQKSVAFYAGRLNITPNYLNILCQRHLHISAISLIQDRVALEAKRLLHATEKSIKEIAFELGFSDMAYFSHFFKKQTGVAPSDFREQL